MPEKSEPQVIAEGKAKIRVFAGDKISKKLPVFYNPVMKANRDISVLLLNSVSDKSLQVALPLAGSGIRGMRFLLELKAGKMKLLCMNDYKEDFFQTIKNNFSLNKIPEKEIIVSNDDANIFLLESAGFDYIDIDPFGSPNPFLDAAIRRISRHGLLAVTATDTSALAGTYERACMRKYWGRPLRNELKHEVGLRILIRKVQLVGAQYEKALVPIFSYSKDHYMRVFFRCEKGKMKADEVIRQHGMFMESGPIWLGALWDCALAKKMAENADSEIRSFLSVIAEESKIATVGFYDVHMICKRNRLMIPRFDALMKLIRKGGCKASRTHFSDFGIRSDIEEKKLLGMIIRLLS